MAEVSATATPFVFRITMPSESKPATKKRKRVSEDEDVVAAETEPKKKVSQEKRKKAKGMEGTKDSRNDGDAKDDVENSNRNGDGDGNLLPGKKTKAKTKKKTKAEGKEKEKPEYPAGLYVDGGHNRQTGDVAWATVTDEKGNDMLEPFADLFTDLELLPKQLLPNGERRVLVANFTDVQKQQNNGAELIAMVAGLRIAIHGQHPATRIYSDSMVIETYWSRGLVRQSTRDSMDPAKLALIEQCVELRKLFEEAGGEIVKISGDANPADLGYH